jgi:hypothetical protein
VSADESEDEHGPSLPDPMRAILRLQIHLWILMNLSSAAPRAIRRATHPILVVEHDRVRCGEIDAEPACARAQEEQARGVWRVTALLEAVHLSTAIQRARRAVDAAQWPTLALVRPVLPVFNESICPALHEGGSTYLDDVEHGDELREDEDLVPARKERVEEPLEDHHLPARVDELLVHDVLVHAWPLEQDRVRADLAQLHHDVLQVHVVDLFHCFFRRNAEHSACAGGREKLLRKRTLGFELMLRSDLGERLGRGGEAAALPRANAHPTQLLVLFDLAGDPLALAFLGVLAGPHASKQPAKAASDDSVVYFVLTLRQRSIQHVLLLGRK